MTDALLDELLTRPIGPQQSNVVPIRAEVQKILLLDIETYPALTWQWSLWDKFTPIERIVRSGGMLSWAAKWYAAEETEFAAVWSDGPQGMAERMHALMCDADAIVTYNGNRFDLPWLRQAVELESGLGPVSPFVSIDLFNTVTQFRFLSKKLDFVVQRLDLGKKVDTGGFSLWTGAMPVELGGTGDPEAQARMEEYNRGDVGGTLEPLYDALLPWIKGHPHVGLYAEDGTNRCQRCGSIALLGNGRAHTPLGVYRRYQCAECKSWSRGKTRIDSVDARAI